MHEELKHQLARLERDLSVFVARFLEVREALDELDDAPRAPSGRAPETGRLETVSPAYV